MPKGSNLPIEVESIRQEKLIPEVWLRISAFMSLKSVNTQRTYKSIISEWCEFLGAPAGSEKSSILISEASDLKALAYRAWLEKRIGQKPRLETSDNGERSLIHAASPKQKKDGLQSSLANATIRKKIAALRRVYRMLVSTGLAQSRNPFDTDSIPPPAANSGQKRPTEMVDFNLVKKIINQPDASKAKGLRDKAVLAALFGGGLRRSEVVALRLGDVRKTPKGTTFLRLRATKAKKDADQAIPGWAADIVNQLCSQRENEGAKSGDYLFISYTGRGGLLPSSDPLSDSGLYKLFKHYCQAAGAGKFVTPHSARATAITKLLEDGLGHREVQEFSRHSSIQMVEVYDKRRIGVDENAAKDLDFD